MPFSVDGSPEPAPEGAVRLKPVNENSIPPHSRACLECGQPLGADDAGCPACRLRLGLSEWVQPVADSFPPAGRRLGRYELLAEIGRGGMGIVFRARQADLGREVAVKVLAGGPFAARSVLERFHTEAALLARLTHPGIVTIHEVGVADGQAFLAMELLPGGSLADRVRDRPLAPSLAAEYLLRLAEAVQYAHAAGVWHRDLKPGNVLLDATGQPRLTDFGLARLAETGSVLTCTGQALGTPGYLAPEQVDGSHHPVGPWSDLYALGAVLYHLLTGRPPFQAATVRDAFRQTLENEPVPPRALNSAVPSDLEVICLRCLAKEPAGRYAEAAALADDLRRHLAGRPILARPEGAVARLQRWRRRHPALATLTAALTVTMVGAFLVVGRFWRQAEAESTRAGQALRQLQRERAADLLAAGRRSPALLQLAELLRRNPADRLAAARAVSLLTWEPFPWPEAHLRGHTAAVTVLTTDARGELAVTGSRDGTARIWNLARPEEPPRVLPHGAPVIAVALTADAQWILSASEDGRARLWPRSGGQPVGEFNHGGPLAAAGIPPDGRTVLTAGADGMAQFWRASGEAVPVRCDAGSEILAARFAPDGERLALGCQGGFAQLFATATGAPIGPRLPHGQRVVDVTFSPDGTRLATASWDGRVRVWNAASGAMLAESPRLSSWATAVAFSPDGRTLAYGGVGHETGLWQPDLAPDRPALWAHDLAVNVLAFSPDGRRVLSAGEDGRVQVRWTADLTAAVTPLRHPDPVRVAAFVPGHGPIITGDAEGQLTLWNPESPGAESQRLNHPGLVFAEGSRDGRRVLTAGSDRVARVWDAASGECLFASDPLASELVFATLSPDGTEVLVCARDGGNHLWRIRDRDHRELLPRHRRGMWRGLFSPDSRHAITLSWDGQARGWAVADGTEVTPPLPHDGPLACAAFDPAGRRLAIGTRTGTVQVWAWPAGTPVGEPLRHSQEVQSVAFSPDGTQLLTASLDRTARRWALPGGQPLAKTDHDSAVTHGVFRPDGSQFVTVSRNRTAQVWSTATGQPAGPPLLHPGTVIQVAFDPTGQSLATVTDQGTAHLWDPASGFSLGELPRSPGALGAVGFSPDGTRLLTAGSDGVARLWPVPDLPVPVPAWLPDLLEFVAHDVPDPAWLGRLRDVVRGGDLSDPWVAWARIRLGLDRP